jgi:hypothetical protein
MPENRTPLTKLRCHPGGLCTTPPPLVPGRPAVAPHTPVRSPPVAAFRVIISEKDSRFDLLLDGVF